MKARVEQIYTERYRGESIPGTRDINAFVAVKVLRYETGLSDPPTVYVTQMQAFFVQHGDAVEWNGFDPYNSEYANTINEYDVDERSSKPVKDAQVEFMRLKRRVDDVTVRWLNSLEAGYE